MGQRVVQPDGQKIARLRREKGWSQAMLAEQAHCNKRTIERLEEGVPVFPRILRAVGEALGVELQTLLVAPTQGPARAWTSVCTPFIAGPPILYPRAFFGRERLLHRLFSLWQHAPLQHAALIGPRGSGKTSLLLYLQQITTTPPAQLRPGQRADWLPHPTRYRWVYVDFEDPRMHRRETLLHHMLTALGLSAPASCSLEQFMEVVSQHLRAPTVILLDEIDVALRRAPELDEDFWEGLRALAATGTEVKGVLGFVLAARESPTQLARAQNLTSPFFNTLAYTGDVGPFTEPEARALLASSPRPFSAADADWILAHSGRWPFLLQILCRTCLMAMEDGTADDAWREEGERQIQPFHALLQSS